MVSERGLYSRSSGWGGVTVPCLPAEKNYFSTLIRSGDHETNTMRFCDFALIVTGKFNARFVRMRGDVVGPIYGCGLGPHDASTQFPSSGQNPTADAMSMRFVSSAFIVTMSNVPYVNSVMLFEKRSV